MKRILLCLFAMLAVVSSYATPYFVTKDGLKYFADPETKTASLTANNYSGDVIVPEKFTDKDIEFVVTTFADECFKDCWGLTSVNIPSTVTALGNDCFYSCSSLKKVDIPTSVTSLGTYCFYGCSSLTSITIPSSVTSLEDYCFSNCSSLTRIAIPSSVTSLGMGCFDGCSSLTSITIPSSVTSILWYCFSGRSNLTSITCEAITPPAALDAFSGVNTFTCLLYVPEGSIDDYKKADGWKDFKYIYKISGGDEPSEEAKPCEKPTITFAGGKLQYSCATAGAKFHSTITTPDVMTNKLDEDGSVDLAAYYDISVYATADGYKASDKATARLYWVKTDGTLDPATSIAAKSMRGIVVSSDDGFVNVSGLNENEGVTFYSVDGKLLGKVLAHNGTTSLATSENVVICKIGGRTLKIQTHL